MQALIIGVGSIGKKHINALRSVFPACKIQALRSNVRQTSENITGVDNIFNLGDVKRPDFIVISTPTAVHLESIQSVLNFKAPLFIEKPIFHKIGKSEDQLVEKLSGFKTYVACNLRFHPAINFLKSTLKNDPSNINEVTVYCGSYLPSWRPQSDFRSVYSSIPELGGGVHLDLIHELDYVTYLFGQPQKVFSLKTNRSSLKIAAMDSARYILEYSDFSVSICLNYFRKDPKRFIEVVREKDTLNADLIRCKIDDLVTGNNIFSMPSYSIATTYEEQIKYFLNSPSHGAMNSAFEAYQILKLALL